MWPYFSSEFPNALYLINPAKAEVETDSEFN